MIDVLHVVRQVSQRGESSLASNMSVLTRNGYTVYKEDLTESDIDELTVTPKIFYPDELPRTFEVFLDNDDGTVAVPRYWGESKFGRADKFYGDVHDADNLVFEGTLRSECQKQAAFSSVDQLQNSGGGVLCARTGMGKCNGINTPILMYDGSIKVVQDVKEGDLLMGDDSTPRRVLSLARGKDEMYDIIPVKGEKYTVNKEHILVLKNTKKKPWIDTGETEKYYVRWWEHFKQNSRVHNTEESAELFLEKIKHKHQYIVEISVKDYIAQSKRFKQYYKGYRTPVYFSSKKLPIDPYMIGIWLGDGTSRSTTQDGVILEYFVNNLEEYGLYLTKLKNQYMYGVCSLCGSNKFFYTLKKLNMINNKHIPMIYKCNSRENRLSLLAGLLDSDGSLCGKCCFDFTQKSEKLIDDVIYLCRSLGFACYKCKQKKGCWYNGEYRQNDYYRITISGSGVEDIPTLLPAKQAVKRRQIKDVLVTGIKVKHVGVGDYYGFTLDGNGRYVLGDFTVTHNTVIALYVACVLKIKTLVVVHKQFLMDQWADRIRQFVPSARIGKLRQNVIDVDNRDIVVGMLQSIAMREYEPEVFDGFGLVIFDEVHVVPAPVFSRALFKSCAPCVLGLSATPERKDGMSYVIRWFIGPVFMELHLENRSEVEVEVVYFPCKFKMNAKNRFAMANITNRLCDDGQRNAMLVRIVHDLVAKGRKVIVLSDRRAHCEALKLQLQNKSVMAGLYIGGMHPHELKESEGTDVLLCTYGLAKEGLDVPDLDALVLASPRSDVVQACGRILHGKSKNPVIVDIVDEWIIGKAQFNKRCVYYKSAGFTLKDNG